MTLTEAMQYRGLTAWKLAERTGVKTQTAKKWTEPGGKRSRYSGGCAGRMRGKSCERCGTDEVHL